MKKEKKVNLEKIIEWLCAHPQALSDCARYCKVDEEILSKLTTEDVVKDCFKEGQKNIKNITKTNLKTCIFKTIDDFKWDIRTASKGNIEVITEWGDISFENISTNEIIDNVNHILIPYYGVKEITSIHIDNYDYTGVWICYKV